MEINLTTDDNGQQNYQKVIQTTREVSEYLDENYSNSLTEYLEMIKVESIQKSRTYFNVSLEEWFARLDHFNQVYEFDEKVIDVLLEDAEDQTLSLGVDQTIINNYLELLSTLYLKENASMMFHLLVDGLAQVIHDEMMRNKEHLTVTQFIIAKLYFLFRWELQSYLIEKYKEDLARYAWEEIFSSKTTGELKEYKDDVKEYIEGYVKTEDLIYGEEITSMNIRIDAGENNTMEMKVKTILDESYFMSTDICETVDAVIKYLEDVLVDLVIMKHFFEVDIPKLQFFDDIVSSKSARSTALQVEDSFTLAVSEFLHMTELGYWQLLTFNHEYFENK